MKYSIVMPVHLKDESHRDVVKNCIGSVKANSEDYEYIIVNDGSPREAEFLREEADTYIEHSEAMGIAPGWNDGISVSRGKYIAVINDDIIARPDWLKAMRDALEEVDKAAVSSCAVEHLPLGHGIREDRAWFPGSCFMLTKETIENIGYFDERFTPFYYEDTDYWTRVYKKGYVLARNYSVQIGHEESDVLHKFENNGEIFEQNKKKFVQKHDFNPIPVFCNGEELPWEN